MKSSPLQRRTGLKSNHPLRSRTFGGIKKSKSLKKTSNPEIQEADSKFSKIIIERDGKCLNCGSPYFLSCSHFHGRGIWATRWDPENCICLCIPDHEILESKKKGAYRDFMIELLGEDKFYALQTRSNLKISRSEALEEAKKLIELNLEGSDIEY